jgi:hypothetical protein
MYKRCTITYKSGVSCIKRSFVTFYRSKGLKIKIKKFLVNRKIHTNKKKLKKKSYAIEKHPNKESHRLKSKAIKLKAIKLKAIKLKSEHVIKY